MVKPLPIKVITGIGVGVGGGDVGVGVKIGVGVEPPLPLPPQATSTIAKTMLQDADVIQREIGPNRKSMVDFILQWQIRVAHAMKNCCVLRDYNTNWLS